MKTNSRLGAIGASFALAAAAATFAMSPAGAAGDFTSDVAGGLTLTTSTGPATLDTSAGSTFGGNFDPAAGSLTGALNLGNTSFTAPGTPIGDVEVAISFTNGGPITDGVVSGTSISFKDVETVNLDTAAGALDLRPCSVGPVTLSYTGTYDPATGEVDVTSDTVDVPALQGTCGGVANMIAPMLEGATVSAHLQFNIGTETTAPTTAPTTTLPEEPMNESTIQSLESGKGCQAFATVDFTQAGKYGIGVKTAAGKAIASAFTTVTEPGTQTIELTIDENHGTKHGDQVTVTLADENGEAVDVVTGEIDDPSACAPSSTSTRPIVKPTSAPAATAMAAQPAYTG